MSGRSPAWVESILTVKPAVMSLVPSTTLNSVFISRSIRSSRTGLA